MPHKGNGLARWTPNIHTHSSYRSYPLGLYVLTPPCVREEDIPLIKAVLATRMVSFLQIRLKGERTQSPSSPSDALDAETLWKSLLPQSQASGTKMIFNDGLPPPGVSNRALDGVHIGQTDTPAWQIKRRIGRGLLGVSCHNSLSLAHRAMRSGADYVAFGAFFPSKTRPDATACSVDVLRAWRCQVRVPALGIGGITVSNVRCLLEARVDGIAVCDAIWKAQNPISMVKIFGRMLGR